uniref:metallophosphoesterase family protein n=1 Tax=Acetatifactor sp. TaxID=1872090 RepID=UPI004056134A
MHIAVIADIHSNYIALEHCMNYALAQDISTFIFLGDYIGDMAYPERTMNLIYEYRKKYTCYFIKGNKENYWLDYRKNGEPGWPTHNSTTGVLRYAYQHLTDADLDFFEGLPISQDITFEGFPTLTACHGSPRSEREQLILNEALTKEILESSHTDYILCGHTHVQGKYQSVLNPGSVGLPLCSKNSCQFMLLHGENNTWIEEFVNLDYDETEVIAQLTESGLMERAPYWCKITAELLRNKGNCSYGHAEVLQRAMELCRLDTGVCNWPDIPEKYWEEAMKDFLPNL